MLHGDRSDKRRAIKNVDNSRYENFGVACQETIVEIRSIAQVAPVSLLAIIPNHFPAAKKHVETLTLPDLVLLAHWSEFCERSKICPAFFGRVCGRQRKHASDEDRKKGEKREVAGAMWGLEKGKRNELGAVARAQHARAGS